MLTLAAGNSEEGDEGERGSPGASRREEIGKYLLGMLLPRTDEDGEAPVRAGEGALMSSPCQVGCPNQCQICPASGSETVDHLFQPLEQR